MSAIFWVEVADSIFFEQLYCVPAQLVESAGRNEIASFGFVGYQSGREGSIAEFGELFHNRVRVDEWFVRVNMFCLQVLNHGETIFVLECQVESGFVVGEEHFNIYLALGSMPLHLFLK